MDGTMEDMLRKALDAEPSAAADRRILAAIRFEAAARHLKRRRRLGWIAAAAGLAVLLGGGIWLHLHQGPENRPQNIVALQDEGDIMLEIIGMADPDEACAMPMAQL